METQPKTTHKRMPWLKFYTKAVDSPVLWMISGDDFRYFKFLLCLKRDGIVDQPDEDMARRQVAVKLRVSLKKLDKILGRLSDVGLVCRGTMQPKNWEKYQQESSKSTPRVDKHRDKKAQQNQRVSESEREDETLNETLNETQDETQWDSCETQDETQNEAQCNALDIRSKKKEVRRENKEEEREAHLTDNETQKKPVRSQGSRLSPDWVPTEEDIAFCKQTRPDLDVDVTADKFRCHWASKTGKDATKLDWHMTWRNWVRNEGKNFVPAKPSVPMDYV